MITWKKNDGFHVVFTREQVIDNAREQAKAGILPMYSYNTGRGEWLQPGFLVLSGVDGCVVVILRDDGTAHIVQAWQGDFAIRLGA